MAAKGLFNDLDVSKSRKHRFGSPIPSKNKLQNIHKRPKIDPFDKKSPKKTGYSRRYMKKKKIQNTRTDLHDDPSLKKDTILDLSKKTLTPMVTNDAGMNRIINSKKLVHSKSTDSQEGSKLHAKGKHLPKGYSKLGKKKVGSSKKPYKFMSHDQVDFNATQTQSHIYTADDPMDETMQSMTFEVDMSAFNSSNILNKSADHLQFSNQG